MRKKVRQSTPTTAPDASTLLPKICRRPWGRGVRLPVCSLPGTRCARPTSLPVVSSVEGPDYFNSTLKAVDLLGGMGRFVKPGSTVGLLANVPGWLKVPGTYARTEVVLATAKMAADAGAKKIFFLLRVAQTSGRAVRSAPNIRPGLVDYRGLRTLHHQGDPAGSGHQESRHDQGPLRV